MQAGAPWTPARLAAVGYLIATECELCGHRHVEIFRRLWMCQATAAERARVFGNNPGRLTGYISSIDVQEPHLHMYSAIRCVTATRAVIRDPGQHLGYGSDQHFQCKRAPAPGQPVQDVSIQDFSFQPGLPVFTDGA